MSRKLIKVFIVNKDKFSFHSEIYFCAENLYASDGRRAFKAPTKIKAENDYYKIAKATKKEIILTRDPYCARVSDFEKKLDAILAAADKAGALPQVIKLSVYESDEDLKYFRPNENWFKGAFEHKGYMIDIAATIKRSYPQIRVKLTPLNCKSYDEWRKKENLPENEATRAQFISLQGEE